MPSSQVQSTRVAMNVSLELIIAFLTGIDINAASVMNAIVQNVSLEGVTGWIDLYQGTDDFENFGRGDRETDIVYKVLP